MSSAVSFASDRACSTGPRVRSIRSLRQLLELRPRQARVQVLRPGRVGRDEGQVDLRRGRGRQLDLGPLGGLVQPLQSLRIVAQVDALVGLELIGQPVDDPLVEVVAAEVAVAAGGTHLDHAVADVEERHVERAAAEVEDEHGLLILLVEAVGQRRRCRLVDDAQHLEPGDLAGVLRRLALGVVEVGGDRDHRLRHLLAQILRCVLGQLAQNERGDLLRRVVLAANVEAHRVVRALDDVEGDDLGLLVDLAPLAADEPLRRVDGGLGVEHCLPLRDLTDEPLPVLGERDYRGCRSASLGIRDDLRLAAFHHRGDHRVGGAQIDAYSLRHWILPLGLDLRTRSPDATRKAGAAGVARMSRRPMVANDEERRSYDRETRHRAMSASRPRSALPACRGSIRDRGGLGRHPRPGCPRPQPRLRRPRQRPSGIRRAPQRVRHLRCRRPAAGRARARADGRRPPTARLRGAVRDRAASIRPPDRCRE